MEEIKQTENQITVPILPASTANIIAEDDSIIVYIDHMTKSLIKLTSTGKFDNKYGTFWHKDIIGKEYGSKVK